MNNTFKKKYGNKYRMTEKEIVERIGLEKRGANYLVRCLWHKEKTPSLAVNFDKDLYYCFGCHRSGGIDDIVMHIKECYIPEPMPKPKAMDWLKMLFNYFTREKQFGSVK